MQGMSENNLGIARNIVRLTSAMICEFICNPDILIAVDLPSLSMGKLGGAITATFIHDIRSISHTYLTAIRDPCIAKIPEILCVPKLSEPELAKLYSMADTLLYLSLHEGSGLVILEAMACGTPVVASIDPALVEVAGDAVMFIKPISLKEVAEIVDNILNDEQLLGELRVGALKRAS